MRHNSVRKAWAKHLRTNPQDSLYMKIIKGKVKKK